MKDTNKAYGCISSSKEGETVYFANKEMMDAFEREYKRLVAAYNRLYHYKGD